MKTYLFFLAIAYLLGSIPFGLIISAMNGIDIQQQGSKNVGATNVFRVVGKKWGVLVFFLDAFKGVLAVLLPLGILDNPLPPLVHVLIGIAAILGHTFPIWLSFKGGKGVATSLGVFLALAPVPSLITFFIWLVIFFLTRIISMASLVAAVVFPLVIFLSFRDEPLFPVLFPVSFFLAALIFYTHRANLGRLRKGEEKKLF